MLCDWLSSSASACDSDVLVSLDRKQWSHKHNQSAVFTRSQSSMLLITAPTPTLLLVKTSPWSLEILPQTCKNTYKLNFHFSMFAFGVLHSQKCYVMFQCYD